MVLDLLAAFKMDAMENWSIIVVTIEIVISLLGIFFNGLVILTICLNIYRLSAPSYLILSIAVSDFLSCSLAIPFSIARHFKKKWPFGMAGCQAHAVMIFLLALVSLTHLAAISAGKYLTVTRSLSKQSYFDTRMVRNVIVSSWMFSIGLSTIPLIMWSKINGLDGNHKACLSDKQQLSVPSDKVYFGAVYFFCYLIALAVITFCYNKIHKVTKNIVQNTRQIGGLPAMEMRRVLLNKHRRSAMYFLTVIAAFMLSWSPYAVVSFLTLLSIGLNPIATSACSVLAQTSFFLNPILYAIVSRRFRRRMVIAVPAMKRQHRRIRPAAVISSVGPLAL